MRAEKHILAEPGREKFMSPHAARANVTSPKGWPRESWAICRLAQRPLGQPRSQ